MKKLIIVFAFFSPLVFGDSNSYKLKSVIEICKDYKDHPSDIKYMQALLEVHDIKNTPVIAMGVEANIYVAKKNETEKGFYYMGNCIEKVESFLRSRGIKKSK